VHDRTFAVGLVRMSDSHERTEMPRLDEHARTRCFTDELGQIWQVTEHPYSEYDRRHGSSLIFSSELAVRRVRTFPKDWFELSDDALMDLSWRV
jgi:hypothetical protein